jgi:hypothetical protein
MYAPYDSTQRRQTIPSPQLRVTETGRRRCVSRFGWASLGPARALSRCGSDAIGIDHRSSISRPEDDRGPIAFAWGATIAEFRRSGCYKHIGASYPLLGLSFSHEAEAL